MSAFYDKGCPIANEKSVFGTVLKVPNTGKKLPGILTGQGRCFM
jgi:hypothetical protein